MKPTSSGKTDIKEFPENPKYKERKTALTKFDVIKAEIIILVAAFALPFLMALVYAVVSDYTMAKVFSRAGRIAALGGVLFFLFNSIACFYFFKRRQTFDFFKELLVIILAIALTYLICITVADYVSLYLAPICIIGLLIAVLINNDIALYVNTIAVCGFYIIYSVYSGVSHDLMSVLNVSLTQILGGAVLILLSKNVYTRLSFFVKGFCVSALVAFPLTFIMGLIETFKTPIEALQAAVWSFVSFISGLAVFMVMLPVFEVVFRMYSTFRLEELCSPDAPLMSRLAKEAPGTYNHSLAMANLAQACAQAIGENVTLARAGACYHDVGKLRNPICFTENQTDYNPHDDYIPEVSVALITRHPLDGAHLIRSCGLPEELARIAEEHHGQTTVGFFFNKTRGYTDEQIANSDFSYKCPKPSTKISGLVMIVDTVEAATRSQGVDKDERNFREFIHRLIKAKVDSGQFTDCPLTLKDLQVIEDTLVKTIPSLYHQRIKYDK